MNSEYIYYATTIDDEDQVVTFNPEIEDRINDYDDILAVTIPDLPLDMIADEDVFNLTNELHTKLVDKVEECGLPFMGSMHDYEDLTIYFATNKLTKAMREKIESVISPYNLALIEDEAEMLYYEILMPNPLEIQHMMNNKEVLDLIDDGELFETEREINFCFEFVDKSDAQRFVFDVFDFAKEVHSTEDEDDGSCHVDIVLVAIPEITTMNKITDILITMCENREGEFIQWATETISQSAASFTN